MIFNRHIYGFRKSPVSFMCKNIKLQQKILHLLPTLTASASHVLNLPTSESALSVFWSGLTSHCANRNLLCYDLSRPEVMVAAALLIIWNVLTQPHCIQSALSMGRARQCLPGKQCVNVLFSKLNGRLVQHPAEGPALRQIKGLLSALKNKQESYP